MSMEESRQAHVQLARQLSTQYTQTAWGYNEAEFIQRVNKMTYYPQFGNQYNSINAEQLPGRINPLLWNRSMSNVGAVSTNTYLWDNVAEVENLPTTNDPNQQYQQWVSVPAQQARYANLLKAVRTVLVGVPAIKGTPVVTASDPTTQVVNVSRSQVKAMNAQPSTGVLGLLKGLFSRG